MLGTQWVLGRSSETGNGCRKRQTRQLRADIKIDVRISIEDRGQISYAIRPTSNSKAHTRLH